MSNLKELTWNHHKNAERQKFASILMSGSIPPISYLRYLINQHACYSTLENHIDYTLPDSRLKRSKYILDDINELKTEFNIDTNEILSKSSLNYVKHVQENIKSFDDFMAHVYVRYLGDLRGGQMIAKRVPGTGFYYQFDQPDELAKIIYNKLHDDMADEAKIVFNYATELFIEMYDIMIYNKEI